MFRDLITMISTGAGSFTALFMALSHVARAGQVHAASLEATAVERAVVNRLDGKHNVAKKLKAIRASKGVTKTDLKEVDDLVKAYQNGNI